MPNSARAKHNPQRPRLPVLEAASDGSYQSYATRSFCYTERQAAATLVFMLCDLATKPNELKYAAHGGYIHVAHRHLI